ncbi:SDR family oxidoreductase [Rossellomorea vietnamensis]|uniref:SDR family oxidoreductase n=1 Tax=Rossellomorea vietnamensis TaxID=218284 RepID=UPI001E5604EF|nr:SDR family oxidoreductase [Rossellomorea vietnamensis]MCC5802177.1 SDR family oxidoreductase [Rossellomorea vietnamensis]
MNVFLTGSTGFLGGKLIKNLLQDKQNEVYILVRNVEKAERLRDSMQSADQGRIHIFQGDITFPYAGLSGEDLEWLTGKIDAVYHLAALVKFDLDLRDELFAANYDGTKNVLELAESLGVKAFYYVSTAYTVGKLTKGVEELYVTDGEFHNPYEESKVKSEHLVYSYRDKMDVSIFRPAIIVGDSKTGEADSQFTLYGFMRALAVFKRKTERRNGERTYRLVAAKNGTSNLVPVDYVADILSLAPLKARPDKIYHITNPDPPENIELLRKLKEALQFENLSVVENADQYELDEEEMKLNSLIEVFKVYLAGALTFEDHNTQELIAGTDISHLEMSDETIEMIIRAGSGENSGKLIV